MLGIKNKFAFKQQNINFKTTFSNYNIMFKYNSLKTTYY